MTKRPNQGVQSNNRIQFVTTKDGKQIFQEYWIHEWDGKDYNMSEHIKDLEQAIKRAYELGNKDEAKKLEKLRHSSNE